MNKYMVRKIVYQILFVLVIITGAFFALLKFNIISLSSSDLPLAILLNQNEIGLKVGNNYQLEAKVYPTGIKYDQIKWTSSDESVVKVNEKTGYLEAYKKGEAIIKASIGLNNLETECRVLVLDSDVLIKKVSIKTDEINLAQGQNYKIPYQLNPSNANVYEFDFISSDNKVAVVNENGTIKAIGAGSAVITIRTKIGEVKDSLIVNVYNYANKSSNSINYLDDNGTYVDEYTYYKTEKINVNKKSIELKVSSKTKVDATVFPINAKKKINWLSSDNKVISVDSNGIITGLQEGSAYVVASSIDGVATVIPVTVKKELIKEENITISDSVMEVLTGKVKTIDYDLYLANVLDKSFEWKSSNPSIATVLNGVVRGLSEGSATITLISSDGLYSDYLTVNVLETTNKIDLEILAFNKTSYTASVNDTITLKPILKPSNAVNRFLTWQSSNQEIAIVENGVIKCLKEGNVTITASNGILSSSILVTIKNVEPSLISIEKDKINLMVGEMSYLVKKIVPLNTTNQEVNWISSNTNVVTVNKLGQITAKNKGRAIITATTLNGKYDQIEVLVS